MKPPVTVQNLWRSFSYIGLSVGTILFATSLSPSLLPRHFAVQGILSGVAFSVGYCIGILGVIFWQYLQLPLPTQRTEKISKFATTAVVSMLTVGFLWRTTVWQNSIRQRMAMEPLETAYPLRVALIALLTGIAILLAARMLRGCWRYVDRHTKRFLPPRISFALSTMLVGLALFLLVNDVVARFALTVVDSVFENMEEVVPDGVEQPRSSLVSGRACIGEIPNMKQAYADWHDKGFDILGISFDQEGEEEKLSAFLKENELPWTQIYEGKGWETELGKQHDVSGIPFVLLVDGDSGEILATARELRGEGLSKFIGEALAKKNPESKE
jgi:hypothetical protein